MATMLAPFTERKTLDNTYAYPGGTVTVLVSAADTGGRFGVVEWKLKPGGEPPLHIHEREDEFFYVLEGEVAVQVADQVLRAKAGECAFLPQGIRHTFRIKSEYARVLTMATPGGFENWFRSLGTPATSFDLPETVPPPTPADMDHLMAVAQQFGLRPMPDPVLI